MTTEEVLVRMILGPGRYENLEPRIPKYSQILETYQHFYNIYFEQKTKYKTFNDEDQAQNHYSRSVLPRASSG